MYWALSGALLLALVAPADAFLTGTTLLFPAGIPSPQATGRSLVRGAFAPLAARRALSLPHEQRRSATARSPLSMSMQQGAFDEAGYLDYLRGTGGVDEDSMPDG
jgi:hypothetical protein